MERLKSNGILINFIRRYARLNFSLFQWDVAISLSALRGWNSLKTFRHDASFHLVWGRLSIEVANGNVECIPVCAECGTIDIAERSIGGDEYLTVCGECGAVECGYTYLSRREYDKAS